MATETANIDPNNQIEESYALISPYGSHVLTVGRGSKYEVLQRVTYLSSFHAAETLSIITETGWHNE